jgi:hypothetical protein
MDEIIRMGGIEVQRIHKPGMGKITSKDNKYIKKKDTGREMCPQYELAKEIDTVTNCGNIERFLKFTYLNYSAAKRALVCIKEMSGIRNKTAYFTKMWSIYNQESI